MRLELRHSDTELVIYREKLGAIAYCFTLGVACVVVAVGAYFLSNQAGVPKPFFIGFSLIFGLAGAAFLLRLSAESKEFAAKGGAHVLSADSWGISITANLGARKQRVLWTSIKEVVLAKRFKTIHLGESSCLGRAVIVFLTNDEYDSLSFLDRRNVGISRSGDDRPFLYVPYPERQEELLIGVLREFAPDSVRVRSEQVAVFDFKKHADSYLNA
ncbi:MAG: hypothetical protein IPG34_02155 [Rhodocyclaceae bacterium]|nr:hypothetical protein [Rhodocyclaceae bacterium]